MDPVLNLVDPRLVYMGQGQEASKASPAAVMSCPGVRSDWGHVASVSEVNTLMGPPGRKRDHRQMGGGQDVVGGAGAKRKKG